MILSNIYYGCFSQKCSKNIKRYFAVCHSNIFFKKSIITSIKKGFIKLTIKPVSCLDLFSFLLILPA